MIDTLADNEPSWTPTAERVAAAHLADRVAGRLPNYRLATPPADVGASKD